MYIFGGKKEYRQIAEVSKKCGIERIGDLAFDFVRGACAVIEDEYIILCFDWKEGNQGKVCRIDKNPTGSLEKIKEESNFSHYRALLSAKDGKTESRLCITKLSISDIVLTVGGGAKKDENVEGNNKTEIYDQSTSKWSTKSDYPFFEIIIDYQLLSVSDGFILFGGYEELRRMSLSIIAKFDLKQNKWIKLTNLQFSRHGFGVIEVEKKFMVLGGKEKSRTEMCQFSVDGLECKSREPTLTGFQQYPAMLKIDPGYTDKCKMFSTFSKVLNSTSKTPAKTG